MKTKLIKEFYKRNSRRNIVTKVKKGILQILDSRFPRAERKEGGITVNEYAKIAKVCTVTARTRLNKLVEKKELSVKFCALGEGVTGAGNKVYYPK